MPEITKHDPGAFSWTELATSDAKEAKKFYGGLFGWQTVDNVMGPDMTYTRLQKSGKDVGGLYGLGPQQTGVPPHWNTYFTVASAAETAKKVEAAGGKILQPVFDVAEYGRMAVAADPQGAVFCLWEPKGTIGTQVGGESNTPCWAELQTTDTEAAQKFYTTVFPWTAKKGGEYTEWQLNGRSIGGMMKIMPEWGPIPPNWLVYIQVDDADAIAKKTQASGGGVRVPPMDIPNTGRFSVLHDPQGATFAVIKLQGM